MPKALGLVAIVVYALAADVGAASAQFPFPVSYASDEHTIELSLLGSYRGGIFSSRSAEGPAAYDPRRHRLYVPSQIRNSIEILDLRNPSLT